MIWGTPKILLQFEREIIEHKEIVRKEKEYLAKQTEERFRRKRQEKTRITCHQIY